MKRIENCCEGKIIYESLEKANEAVRHLNQLGGLRVNSYRCQENKSHFHIGHNCKGKKLSPKDKFKKTPITYIHQSKTHIVENKFLKPE